MDTINVHLFLLLKEMPHPQLVNVDMKVDFKGVTIKRLL